jgi:hypothetical protein
VSVGPATAASWWLATPLVDPDRRDAEAAWNQLHINLELLKELDKSPDPLTSAYAETGLHPKYAIDLRPR